jgi:hypothetical protein
MYDRVAGDLMRIRTAYPAYAQIERGGCYRPDRLWLLFHEALYPHVQAGNYTAWNQLNAALRGAPTDEAPVANVVWVEFDGLYNMNRVVREYQRLPGVISAGTEHWPGINTRACMAERGFYNLYILGLGSGDCPAGCRHWRYIGVAVDDAGNVVPLGEYDTATMGEPRWFERAADCVETLEEIAIGVREKFFEHGGVVRVRADHLGVGKDRGEDIVDLVNDARGKSADHCQPV